MNSIEKLSECAKLRGVSGLLNRTIQEFNWFVQGLIYGAKDLDPIWSKRYMRVFREGVKVSDIEDFDILVDLFYKYCLEEYSPKVKRKIWKEEMKTLKRIAKPIKRIGDMGEK